MQLIEKWDQSSVLAAARSLYPVSSPDGRTRIKVAFVSANKYKVSIAGGGNILTFSGSPAQVADFINKKLKFEESENKMADTTNTLIETILKERGDPKEESARIVNELFDAHKHIMGTIDEGSGAFLDEKLEEIDTLLGKMDTLANSSAEDGRNWSKIYQQLIKAKTELMAVAKIVSGFTKILSGVEHTVTALQTATNTKQ